MIVVELVREAIPDIPVLFLETGYHFARGIQIPGPDDTAPYNLNLVNVMPQQSLAEHEAEFGLLYPQRPDECCKRRKVGPLFAALEDLQSVVHGSAARAVADARESAGYRPLPAAFWQGAGESQSACHLE